MPIPAPDLLTLLQAARRVGRHPDTLRQQIINGRLQGVKLGRDWFVTDADLNAYLKQRWSRRTRAGKRRAKAART